MFVVKKNLGPPWFQILDQPLIAGRCTSDKVVVASTILRSLTISIEDAHVYMIILNEINHHKKDLGDGSFCFEHAS